VLKTEAEVIWKKLVRLGAIASLTAAFQESVGVIRSDAEKRKHLEAMVYEGALVALKEGVELNPAEVLQQIDALPENLTTSLQRDVRLKTTSEVEAITGGVIRLASLYDIPVPTYVYAYEQIMKRY
jgi:2-dehydropantoate 2-reductase